MRLRETKVTEIDDVMEIINDAKRFLKDNKINQWQDNYPNHEIIKNDILRNESYVLEKDNLIIATIVLSFQKEETYESIEGKWINNNPYATIHRIAISNEYKGQGISKILMNNVYNKCLEKDFLNIRVDTHEDNLVMKSFLNKEDFQYCGIIYLKSGAKRLAYQKVLVR